MISFNENAHVHGDHVLCQKCHDAAEPKPQVQVLDYKGSIKEPVAPAPRARLDPVAVLATLICGVGIFTCLGGLVTFAHWQPSFHDDNAVGATADTLDHFVAGGPLAILIGVLTLILAVLILINGKMRRP